MGKLGLLLGLEKPCTIREVGRRLRSDTSDDFKERKSRLSSNGLELEDLDLIFLDLE